MFFSSFFVHTLSGRFVCGLAAAAPLARRMPGGITRPPHQSKGSQRTVSTRRVSSLTRKASLERKPTAQATCPSAEHSSQASRLSNKDSLQSLNSLDTFFFRPPIPKGSIVSPGRGRRSRNGNAKRSASKHAVKVPRSNVSPAVRSDHSRCSRKGKSTRCTPASMSNTSSPCPEAPVLSMSRKSRSRSKRKSSPANTAPLDAAHHIARARLQPVAFENLVKRRSRLAPQRPQRRNAYPIPRPTPGNHQGRFFLHQMRVKPRRLLQVSRVLSHRMHQGRVDALQVRDHLDPQQVSHVVGRSIGRILHPLPAVLPGKPFDLLARERQHRPQDHPVAGTHPRQSLPRGAPCEVEQHRLHLVVAMMGRDHSRQTEFPHQAGKPPVAQIPRRHLDRALFPQGVFPGIEGLPKQFHPPPFDLPHRKALIPQGFLPPQVKVAMRRHERHLCLFEQVSQYGRVHPAAESQKKTPPGEKFRKLYSHVFQKPSVQAVFHPLALMDAKIRKAAVSDGLTPRPLLS